MVLARGTSRCGARISIPATGVELLIPRLLPAFTRRKKAANALFSFPSLAAYEDYRAAIRQDPAAQQLWQLSTETRCIRRFDRTFLRPAMRPSSGVGTGPHNPPADGCS